MIDFTQIIISLVGGVFSVASVALVGLINSRMKDKQAADVLSAAVTNSLGAMRQAAEKTVTEISPRVDTFGMGKDMKIGVAYVLDHAGTEAKRFGIGPEAIAEKINARLGNAKLASDIGAVPVHEVSTSLGKTGA